ncbi:MAG: hypothetical protein A2Y62_10270 [Candidatus Fischerbacteria bacterium RBG_13_37_8]|uniref:Glutamine amidotransferase type-2 domain-containing protein n=1 Tax=Candidatus Fischerbacteria bacterium RBG_13_37_8 TaxID=1817863 RepID=A0A1F5VXZ9_9BACT|nr:MAG: hypothetical protein A2Y62_10270 [Candidatus Fischerbacteria bacterium RBG_13_37_8]
MCRLLGLVANKKVDLIFSMTRFEQKAHSNPDGWGMGWYDEDKSARIYKEALSALDKEAEFYQASCEAASTIIIAHVRTATMGSASDVNSHPFNYKNWIFAHNGSINRRYIITQLHEHYRISLKGDTDSEAYFHWLIQNIEEGDSIVDSIANAIAEIKKIDYGGLNFILSDGKRLYAYRDANHNLEYYSLYVLLRAPTHDSLLDMFSEETRVLLHSKTLHSENAVLICSEKLTEEDWLSIPKGHLVEVREDLTLHQFQLA